MTRDRYNESNVLDALPVKIKYTTDTFSTVTMKSMLSTDPDNEPDFSDESSETYFNNLSDYANSDKSANKPAADYFDLIMMINLVSDLIKADGAANQADNTLILTKMWRLHLDAADHAGVSIANNLYSTRELYHLAIAKYYESRIDDLDHNASMQVAIEQHETFKQFSRVLVDEDEEGIKI